MSRRTHKPLMQSSVVLECFAQLEVESVGRRELEAIRSQMSKLFGDAVPSPAAIARLLADHDVQLRHPEILDSDTEWREAQLKGLTPREFATIDDAFAILDEIQTLAETMDSACLKRLRTHVLQIQQELELVVESEITHTEKRGIASELALWFRIWLQNPAIFDDWLSLRRTSPEFLIKFP